MRRWNARQDVKDDRILEDQITSLFTPEEEEAIKRFIAGDPELEARLAKFLAPDPKVDAAFDRALAELNARITNLDGQP